MIPVRVLPQAEAELLHEVEYDSSARDGAGIPLQAAVGQPRIRHPAGATGIAPATVNESPARLERIGGMAEMKNRPRSIEAQPC